MDEELWCIDSFLEKVQIDLNNTSGCSIFQNSSGSIKHVIAKDTEHLDIWTYDGNSCGIYVLKDKVCEYINYNGFSFKKTLFFTEGKSLIEIGKNKLIIADNYNCLVFDNHVFAIFNSNNQVLINDNISNRETAQSIRNSMVHNSSMFLDEIKNLENNIVNYGRNLIKK